MQPKRCSWLDVDHEQLREYHDREWGVPVHDDRKHFEFLVLEGAQAGLSWSTVLKNPRAIAVPSASSILKKWLVLPRNGFGNS